MKRPLITLTSDFGVQSQAVGIMEATILDISPEANVVHLMHGLPDYDLITAARIMETVITISGGIHLCVVDPGVGTERRAIIIKTKRGDHLIGPDNGILIPAAHMLGGCRKAVEITNPKYMKHPVSPVFHGRDIFSPAAAYLSKGTPIEKFGRELEIDELAKAPYEEAVFNGNSIVARVIHINKYGSLVLNVLPSVFDKLKARVDDCIILKFSSKRIVVPFAVTFGDVPKGRPVILKDDYGRVEVAVNHGSFAQSHEIRVGESCILSKK